MSTDPRYKDHFPNTIMMKDEKLGQVLQQLKDRFNEGVEMILYLKRFT
jgi:hypothetical protein